ncbi:MAG: Xaa-Pro aminopeptidase [Myxococcota bacterium]|jgi:Xaa-Pro aminopeptidase
MDWIMSESSTVAYAGDDALLSLLAQSGVAQTAAEVRALIAGINAAPPTRTVSEWVGLVAPKAGSELQGQLVALKGELSRGELSDGNHDGWNRDRIVRLRAEMAARGLDGFVVTRADEHQNEYVPARAERLLWSTAFGGSAGAAIIMQDTALVFADGRYTLQVRDEVDLDIFEPLHLIEQPPHRWIAENLTAEHVLGFDPWMHTVNGAQQLAKACRQAGATLKAVETNPLDAAWLNQPPEPVSPVIIQSLEFSGQSAEDKRQGLASALGAHACVLTLPDSIAWLLNIRGGDVPHTPLPLAFALLFADGSVDLCIDARKLTPGIRTHLGDAVRVFDKAAFGARLDALAGSKVVLDPAKAADWISRRLEGAGAQVVHGTDPCLLPKACKNAVELDGTRAAHTRDGAALTRFLRWIDINAAAGGIDELAAAEKLYGFRCQDPTLRDLSFDTISGSGPNGAIVHYRVSEATNRPLEAGNLYLVDSGGQYPDGTTDVTRTLAIGTPTAEMKDRFTRVLKGHIALGTARFAPGTTGAQLDALARLPLWQVGLDYDHGTGHGVGSYLAVHEGPQRISKAVNTVALRPGMIVSNEPGYYKTDGYGIRIENLVAVRSVDIPGGERQMLEFETLTLAPIDRNLVDVSLLNDSELGWLNDYHARVRTTLTPLLDQETAKWLETATAPIAG